MHGFAVFGGFLPFLGQKPLFKELLARAQARYAALDILMRLISRGGYSIVKDTVFSLSRGEFQKNARHPVNAIYFSKYGRYVESGVEFDITSVGDEFYLVILEGKKEDIAYAFHTKMYEYKHI